jgi:hypothetical protein
MKQYAVIHAVAGLYEGYSDTTCEFFPTKEAAQKHIDQILLDYGKDEMCVCIEHQDDGVEVTMTRDYENYQACVPSDMEHDDWVADNGDDCSVEVFRIIEIDCERYENAPSTEHMWLTWDQQDTCQAWDYTPLCMSLVARVASDVQDNTGKYACHETNMYQLTEFISDVYYRSHAFIDIDDYTMHAFRIPKPQSVKS